MSLFSFSHIDGERNKINITGYNGPESSYITIPSKIGEFFVKGIADGAFQGQSLFTDNVMLEHGIEVIGPYAFSTCDFKTIFLPPTILRIEERAFEFCESLESVIFKGNAPLYVNDDAFDGSENVKVFHYPTTARWTGTTFKGRPLEVVEENIVSLGESDDNDGEIMSEDDTFEKEQAAYAEDVQEEQLWEAEKVEYMTEIKAHERSSFMYAKPTSLKNVAMPREAFKIRLNNAFDKSIRLLKGLHKDDIQRMIEPLWSIEHIEFKNPVAYMLGYYVVVGNRIDRGRFDIVKRELENITTQRNEITPTDVIRYAYYWINVLLPSMRAA